MTMFGRSLKDISIAMEDYNTLNQFQIVIRVNVCFLMSQHLRASRETDVI